MALIYNPANLRLLRPGAKINPPKGTYIYDIHPRIHNLDDLMTKIYEELTALDAAIGTSSAQIAINTANIASNLVLINTNISNISALSAEVAGINTQVNTNTSDISSLASITTTNATNIANNTTNITANTTQIATNTTNIATNAGDLAALTISVSNNTTNIATNTTDIAANTAAIAALYQIIRVDNETDFIAAFATLASTGGAIVLDGAISLTSTHTINCTDIQVWGMNNQIRMYESTGISTNVMNKLVLSGNNAFFREVSFAGCSDFNLDGTEPYFNWGNEYTKTCIEVNSGTFGRLTFVDCTWYDMIAAEDGGVTDEPLIDIVNAANWFSMKFERNDYATRASTIPNKPYGGFRIGRQDTYDGWRVIFYDLTCTGTAGTIGLANTYQNLWAESVDKGNTCFITDEFLNHASSDVQRDFVTDGTCTYDEDRSYYTTTGPAQNSPFLWNIVNPKNQAYHWEGTVDPTASATYGKPGDSYRDTATDRLFMKVGTLRKDNNWKELYGAVSPAITTLQSDVSTNTTNITTNTTDIAAITAAGVIQKATLTLNALQVGSINGTPITIVAAPAITEIIVPTMAICELDYSGGTVISADETFELIVATATHPCLLLDSVITQNGTMKMVASANSAPSLGDRVLMPGRPLQVTAASNPTNLNGSTSSWKITLWYRIVTV